MSSNWIVTQQKQLKTFVAWKVKGELIKVQEFQQSDKVEQV